MLTTSNPSLCIHFLVVSTEIFQGKPGSRVSLGKRSSFTHWQNIPMVRLGCPLTFDGPCWCWICGRKVCITVIKVAATYIERPWFYDIMPGAHGNTANLVDVLVCTWWRFHYSEQFQIVGSLIPRLPRLEKRTLKLCRRGEPGVFSHVRSGKR